MGTCHSRARSVRGNALLLSVMILLTLTAVGIMAVMRTNTELMVSGNVARSMQASLAAEAGLFHALGLIRAEPNNYLLTVQGQNTKGSLPLVDLTSLTAETCNPPAATKEKGLDVACRSSSLAVADVNHHLPVVQPDPALEIARLNQDLAYDSRIIPLSPTDMPGYETTAKICFRISDVSARGGIPTRREAISSTLCPRNDAACVAETVVIETRARAVVGPTTACN